MVLGYEWHYWNKLSLCNVSGESYHRPRQLVSPTEIAVIVWIVAALLKLVNSCFDVMGGCGGAFSVLYTTLGQCHLMLDCLNVGLSSSS